MTKPAVLTPRSVALLEAEDWLCWRVEYYNAFTKRRHDLFNLFDLLALKRDRIMGVQITSLSNMSSRRNKIAESPYIGRIRESGMEVELMGWFKNKSGRWACKRECLS